MNLDSIIKKLRESRVGAFYFIGNKIISNSVPLKDGDTYGDFTNYSSHWDLWKSLVREYPEYKYFDYDYYPRGRVVFDRKRWKYILYIDLTFLNILMIYYHVVIFLRIIFHYYGLCTYNFQIYLMIFRL